MQGMALIKIIPVKSNIQLAVGDRRTGQQLLQGMIDPVRQVDTTRLQAYQHSILKVEMILNQLVAKPVSL